jgi:hypothetical protein
VLENGGPGIFVSGVSTPRKRTPNASPVTADTVSPSLTEAFTELRGRMIDPLNEPKSMIAAIPVPLDVRLPVSWRASRLQPVPWPRAGILLASCTRPVTDGAAM